ncbi:MAG: ABC transporter ATP-binding protein [Kangiellaceae bacterium]|nr:ABC transporter ATP-binding protein [Kangiellaceae bacterium]
MLRMNNVSKIFQTRMIETHALRDVDIHIKNGEFVSVTGPSGSGKTTFLNIAGLLENLTKGQYFLDGQDVSQLSDNRLSEIRNEKIGFIFQSFNLLADLSLYDNVDVPLRYRGFNKAERKERIERALEIVGLSSRHDHLPTQLSGGQQQRVAIARAIAGEPKIILADEPTGNLDSLMARQVMELLEKINEQGTTIVMVTHDPVLAKRADREIQIFDGQVNSVERDETDQPVQTNSDTETALETA